MIYKPGADEVLQVGPMGWVGSPDQERKALDTLQSAVPIVFSSTYPSDIMPEIETKWNLFQKSKGRHDGSCDLTLLDDFVFGRNYAWEDQFIGSCVISNTFRGHVKRQLIQTALFGQPVEWLGKEEFGPKSIAPYAPWSYGMMRKRGNLRGGDGGFCEAMGQSLLLDGVLPCNSPLLLTLLKQLGADTEKDFPEPRSNRIYRAFGDWKYNDILLPDACCRLLDSDVVTSVDQQVELGKVCKPLFQCSMIAIKKVGTHKDGFAIHARDTQNQWAHNMGWQGFFIASDGRRFHRLSNESWGDEIIYNIPDEELDDWYKRRLPSTMSIGQIDLKLSKFEV